MSMLPIVPPDYSDGRTKQSFKDSCDINKILAKAQVAGSLSHFQKHGAFYGDFADFDFLDAQVRLARGKEIFAELPSEVRREFDQDPAKFFAFANDPANAGKLVDLIPGIAKPGMSPAVQSWKAKVKAASQAASEPVASVSEAPPAPPQGTGA